MPVENILEMRSITKEFPGVVALRNVDFTCRTGEIHALLGENGAGKSTLMKLLSGDSRPNAGEIFFKGERFSPPTPLEAMSKGIAIIYQELNLVPNLNAYENIFLGREPAKGIVHDFGKMRRDALEYLGMLDCSFDIDVEIEYLSVAQQQMIEIAKALSMNASLIVMDEPTSSLTSSEIRALFNVTKKLKANGVSVIFISHHLDEVFELADRVTILKDGEFVATMPTAELDEPKLISLMVGRELDQIYPHKGASRGERVLSVRNLSLAGVLRDISFDLHAGEIVGVAGLMGAGRTELAETLFGVRRFTGGEMEIRGKKFARMTPKIALKEHIGFLTEDRKTEGLLLDMKVKENITLSIMDEICKVGVISRKKEKEVSARFIRDLRIKTPSGEAAVVNLSGGNQQKVVLGKWLACRSNIFILDEPTRGIDVGAKMEIYARMRQLAESGNAILMISSELPEVIGMSDRVLVMRGGTITGEVGPDGMTEDRIMTYAMGGTAV